ncbi:hypothetical protein BV898_14313 [Hypsibius exemplaris]|uniref:Sm domain-containing protein n=1 Tax=Hypsibius exemplaris TaxID=2072580 RepID=A0A9X6RJB4_HYPEX|nr:hypothetical protein BV898_14313 [Hypsibius exemplaris]
MDQQEDQFYASADEILHPVGVTTSTNPSSAAGKSSPGRDAIRKLFHRELKVVLVDDRVIIGSFFCTDRDCNIVLGGAREYENEADFAGGKVEPRFIGLVMVNKKNTKAVFVDEKAEDAVEGAK